jgi:membrane protein YdbS with pleckstrin-like domain
MIYEALKGRLLELIKAPTEPPEPPAGSKGSIQTFRADPNFLKLRLIVWGVGFAGAILGEIIFILIEVFVLRDHADRTALVVLGALLLAVTLGGAIGKYFLIRIDYDMRYYVVTDRSLRIREGALLIHESTFTFANIQNLKLTQGPLERLLGLSNLIVETAGGAAQSQGDKGGKNPFAPGHEGNLRGIAHAREVRDQMLVLLKKYRDAGLGDPEDRGKAVPGESVPGGFTPAVIERLGEVLEEVRLLGRVLR